MYSQFSASSHFLKLTFAEKSLPTPANLFWRRAGDTALALQGWLPSDDNTPGFCLALCVTRALGLQLRAGARLWTWWFGPRSGVLCHGPGDG